MEVIADGFVCNDCVLMIANGETSNPDHDKATINRIAEATAGWCLSDEERNQHFSMTPCRTCGCKLGGERHWAVKLG